MKKWIKVELKTVENMLKISNVFLMKFSKYMCENDPIFPKKSYIWKNPFPYKCYIFAFPCHFWCCYDSHSEGKAAKVIFSWYEAVGTCPSQKSHYHGKIALSAFSESNHNLTSLLKIKKVKRDIMTSILGNVCTAGG